jgi:hypothetical protein
MEINAKGIKHLNALSGIDKEMKAGIRFGLYNFADKLRKDIRAEILKKNKTGKVYIVKKGNRRYRHRASAKGEAPANLSGNLRASVGFQVQGTDMKIGYRDKSSKGNSVNYGKYLEVNLKRNALEQAINNNASDFKEFINKGVNDKVVKKIQQGKR